MRSFCSTAAFWILRKQLSSIASKHCNHTFSHCVSFRQVEAEKSALEQEAAAIMQKLFCWQRTEWLALVLQRPAGEAAGLAESQPCGNPRAGARRVGAVQLGRKSHWANLARGANLEASHSVREEGLQPELYGGFWDIGASEGWPLARHTLAYRCNQVKRKCRKPGLEDSLRSHGHFSRLALWARVSIVVLSSTGPPSNCFGSLCSKKRQPPKQRRRARSPLLLSLKSASTETERVLVAFHTRRAPLQAAVLLPEPGAQDAVASSSLSSLAEPIRPASLVSSSLLCKPQVPWLKVMCQVMMPMMMS